MSSLAALNNTAFLILQPQRQQPAGQPPADNLVATINGASSPATSGSPLMQAQGKINESMFSVNNTDSTQMKARLFERAGQAFGIKQDDYDSLFAYGSAIKKELGLLKARSPSAVTEIEKKLGLDKLGVSLDSVVNAIIDPQGSDGDKLDAALKKYLGEHGNKGDGKGLSPQPDEIGIYGR